MWGVFSYYESWESSSFIFLFVFLWSLAASFRSQKVGFFPWGSAPSSELSHVGLFGFCEVFPGSWRSFFFSLSCLQATAFVFVETFLCVCCRVYVVEPVVTVLVLGCEIVVFLLIPRWASSSGASLLVSWVFLVALLGNFGRFDADDLDFRHGNLLIMLRLPPLSLLQSHESVSALEILAVFFSLSTLRSYYCCLQDYISTKS